MRKTILTTFAGFVAAASLLFAFYVHADDATLTTLNPFKVVSGFITPNNTNNGIKVPSLASSGLCLKTDSSGKFATTTCGTGGGGSSATTTINSALGPNFTFSTTKTGTDFTISTSTGAVIFNLPNASASATGTLTAADWTLFNNKQNALVNPVTGSGTATQIAFWDTASTINSDSNLYWDNTNKRLGVGGTPGTAKLYVNGNVGIGTTSPQVTLHVYNSGSNPVRFESGSSGQFVSLDFLKAGNGYGRLIVSGGLSDFGILATQSTGKLNLGAGGTSALNMTLVPGGNVGIGTTTPNATLHVYGSNAFKYTKLATSVSTYNIATSTDNTIYISTTTVASTINLPACQGNTDQIEYIVKDLGGNAGTNNITVTATAGNVIDGASTKVINSNYGSTKVQCVSGSGWFSLP